MWYNSPVTRDDGHILPMRRWLFSLLLLLTGCIGSATSDRPSTGMVSNILYVDEAIAGTPPDPSTPILGYLYADAQGVFLADQLVLRAGTSRLPHGRDPPHIWIGMSLSPSLERVLSNEDSAYYGVAQAQGRLEGPATFGPEGRYRYQLDNAMLTVLFPLEISIRDLISMPAAESDHQLVEVEGDMLLNDQSALLFEQLGSGGVPVPDSRQIKLTYPPDPASLTYYLTSVPSSTVHFGPVRIVGIWSQNSLRPLAYTPLDI